MNKRIIFSYFEKNICAYIFIPEINSTLIADTNLDTSDVFLFTHECVLKTLQDISSEHIHV